MGFDLEWTTDGSPYHYLVTTRYEIPCTVAGELTIGDESIAIKSHGQRDHSWGVRDWWAFGWCWASARLDDGTRLHLADIRIPGHPVGFGYVQVPGRDVQPVSGAKVDEELGAWGMPTGARARIEPAGIELDDRTGCVRPAAPRRARRAKEPLPSRVCPVRHRRRSRGDRVDRVEPTRGVTGSAVASRRCASPSTRRTDRSACQFVHRVRTRFAETDAMGIIHHGAYAVYLEEARAAFLEAAGHPYREVQDEGVGFPVLELYLAYHRPLHFGETVDVGITVGELTRTSFQVGYLLDVNGETRATATSVHAAIDHEGRPVRLPSWMRAVAAFGRRL